MTAESHNTPEAAGQAGASGMVAAATMPDPGPESRAASLIPMRVAVASKDRNSLRAWDFDSLTIRNGVLTTTLRDLPPQQVRLEEFDREVTVWTSGANRQRTDSEPAQ